MHPYDHARSSERIWNAGHDTPAPEGSLIRATLPLHAWFDATKAAYGDWRHRALRHHRAAFAQAAGAVPELGEPYALTLCEQHLREDLGRVPDLHDWRIALRDAPWMAVTHDSEARAHSSVRRFGGRPEDTLDLHAWLDARCEADSGYGFWRHHAWGLFEAEEVFGVTRRIGEREAPVRVILEGHLCDEYRRIPSVQDWCSNLARLPWMAGAKG